MRFGLYSLEGITLIYFKDEKGQVYAYEPSDIEKKLVPEHLTQMSHAETYVFLNRPPAKEELVDKERQWRDSELNQLDYLINMVQDGEVTGDELALRQYRIKLRNWPQSEYFPDSDYRPSMPV